jgi:hypothetical protein
MEWLLLALTGGSGGAFAVQRLRVRRADRRRDADALASVQRLAEEDVAVLGEQLQRLGHEVGGRSLDERTRGYYQAALDGYESAGRQVGRLRGADDVDALVDTLAVGRHALACARARVGGLEVPRGRMSCYFNPQHGSSTHDIEWTPPRHGTRTVPACDQCAERVAARARLELRVLTGRTRSAPYGDTAAALSRARRPFALGVAAAGVGLAWSFDPRDGLDGWG